MIKFPGVNFICPDAFPHPLNTYYCAASASLLLTPRLNPSAPDSSFLRHRILKSTIAVELVNETQKTLRRGASHLKQGKGRVLKSNVFSFRLPPINQVRTLPAKRRMVNANDLQCRQFIVNWMRII